MLFLTLSNANVNFLDRELQWGTYITQKAVLTTKRIELVGKKKFAAATLDLEHKTFVVYVTLLYTTFLSFTLLNVHLSHRPQITGLIAKETLTKVTLTTVFTKYLDFADVSSLDLASKLSKHTKINNHAIKLVNGQQPPYKPIYSLGPVELRTLKAYIRTNLANEFIKLTKSTTGIPIFFDWKSDKSFRLCLLTTTTSLGLWI